MKKTSPENDVAQVSAKNILGNQYSDPISGWKGVATGVYQYLYGCTRVQISGSDKEGKPNDYVFDFPQLEPVEAEPAPYRAAGDVPG